MERKKILLVDRSEATLVAEKAILRQKGYQLSLATDGEQALQKALAERPDLILLDVAMPKMDGFEACRKLRTCEATKTALIIMVIMRGEEDTVETGFLSGFNDYVTKPISSRELASKVESYLGGG